MPRPLPEPEGAALDLSPLTPRTPVTGALPRVEPLMPEVGMPPRPMPLTPEVLDVADAETVLEVPRILVPRTAPRTAKGEHQHG